MLQIRVTALGSRPASIADWLSDEGTFPDQRCPLTASLTAAYLAPPLLHPTITDMITLEKEHIHIAEDSKWLYLLSSKKVFMVITATGVWEKDYIINSLNELQLNYAFD